MENSFHLRNGVTCATHVHGASCAIDVLLEVAYFGMYQWDSRIFQSEGNSLSSKVHDFCSTRNYRLTTDCLMREDVWDWLVSHRAEAFAPKGTIEAEALVGFLTLSTELHSRVGFSSMCPLHPLMPVLTLTTNSVESAHGMFGQCLEHEVVRIEGHWSKRCRACIGNGTMRAKDFIIVELSVADWQNKYNRPITIPETCIMFEHEYYLTAAILVQPQHFLCIARIGQRFARIDGIQHDVEWYSSFTSAVYRSQDMTAQHHITSQMHEGIHLVVLTRLGSRRQTGINSSQEDDSMHANCPQQGLYPPSDGINIKSQSTERSSQHDLPPSNKRSVKQKTGTQNKPKRSGPLSTGQEVKGKHTHEGIIPQHCSTPSVGRNLPQGATGNQTGHVMLCGKNVGLAVKDGSLYLSCKDVFELLGMQGHIRQQGYRFIDKALQEEGMSKEADFILRGTTRKFISYRGLSLILDKRIGHKSGPCESLKKELVSLCYKELVNSFLMRQFISKDDKDKMNSSMETDPSPLAEKSREYVKKVKAGRSGYSRKRTILRKKMKTLCRSYFEGDPRKLAKGIGELFKPSKGHDDGDGEFGGSFNEIELENLLNSLKSTKSKTKMLNEVLRKVLLGDDSLSSSELIHLEENFSGTRLFDQLRSRLPGLLPPLSQVRQQKKLYWQEFRAILLPARSATGWKISMQRLMEILSFRYYWLESPAKWRMYGDGREIGGRKSTFMAISILNDEAQLRGTSYQNPLEIFPISIFYEDDSRDNLEENLGYPNGYLNNEVEAAQMLGHQFFLSGDEMFLEHILGDEGEFAPTSATNWNIYSSYPKSDWGNTDVNGLRTGLRKAIDRDISSAILKAIPLQRTVFCLLHSLARVAEKFLNLEIQRLFTSSHLACQQTGMDAGTYVKEAIRNLEQNVNRRGVRQGNFHVVMKGNLAEDVRLNKTHAESILSDPPAGMEAEFPHVLTGVVPDTLVPNTLEANVKRRLNLPEQFTEFELVVQIWKHFYKMHSIINQDSKPKLKPGCLKGSKRRDDYEWGYSAADISEYTAQAEMFYQLFKLRYTCKNFTPYMMKYVDYGSILMRTLPISVGRFQSEGGEHANYLHNCYYYNHTTRHGGGYRLDPTLAILNNVWKRISYHIVFEDGSEDGLQAKHSFMLYKRRHMAAFVIQRNWKSYKLRKRANRKSQPNIEAPTHNNDSVFEGTLFVLSGAIPQMNGERVTRPEFSKLITDNGGRLRSKLPNGSTAKRFIVLSGPVGRKIPAIVRSCERYGHLLLNHSFVTDSIGAGHMVDVDNYKVQYPGQTGIPKAQSLQSKHFKRRKRMMTIIKKAKKTLLRSPQTMKIPPVAKNVAIYYAQTRRKSRTARRRLTFEQSKNVYYNILKEWTRLSGDQKDEVHKEYRTCLDKKRKQEDQRQKREEQLKKRNSIENPAYAGLVDF